MRWMKWTLAMALAAGLAAGAWAQSVKNLPARYREWLERDAVYIISEEERQIFLRLASDADRDRFIEQFWLARDPSPGTPANEFKDEHYKRIEYANQHFSQEWSSEGWRTDRGKIWIILGPPQTRQFHTSGGQVYPIELWFYSSTEPALPPFFYVMFYQREGASDYRLYSPYIHGPDKLVRGSGMENNRRVAYRFLKDINPELAKASLTLIPSEPADINTSSSLSSDALLMKIINLKDDKFHKEKILVNRRLQEEVSTRLLRDPNAVQVAVLPLRDAAGNDFIHYALQITEPENYTLTRYKDQYYLSMEARVRVLDAQKNLIYETSREAVLYVEEKNLDEFRSRPFSFEDKLPVVPGTYILEIGLLNRVTRSYYKASASVEVEEQPAKTLSVGKVLLVQSCVPSRLPEEPWVLGGSRCTVLSRPEVPGGANASISLLYPVYRPLSDPGAAPQPLKVQYTFGRLDRSVAPVVVDDTLDPQRATRFGTLIVGKSLPVKEIPDGSYLLSIRVTDPASGRTAGTTIPVRLGGPRLPTPNLMTPENLLTDLQQGNLDYWRGLCARAAGQHSEAKTLLARAIEMNAANTGARAQLAALLYDSGEYVQAAALLESADAATLTDAASLRVLIASLSKTGQFERALTLAEQGLPKVEANAALFSEVADLYEKVGKQEKAREMREEARRVSLDTKPKQ